MKSESLEQPDSIVSDVALDPRALFLHEWAAVQYLCERLAEAGANPGAAYRALPPIIPNTRL